MKQGAPIRDVNMDTGISVAMTDLAAVSIMSINRAPDAILAGTTDRLSFPNIMRTMWGMRSPIQPICPHIETTAAVIADEAATVIKRKPCTDIPKLFTSSSLSINASSFHLKSRRITIPAKIQPAPDKSNGQLIFFKLPKSQYVIDGSSSCGSATYFANDTIDEKNEPIIIPESTRRSVLFSPPVPANK